jgi:hypothetical protein
MPSITRSLRLLSLLGAAVATPRTAFTQPPAATPKVEAITIKQGLATLKGLIDQPAPDGLNAADQAQWKSQTDWLTSAYERLSVLTARESSSGMATGRKASPDATTAAKLEELKATLARESRKFQTLSNASKTRHDMAMSAIRNVKA